MKFCEECGAEMEDNALFCEECGAKCEVAAKEESAGEATPAKGNGSNPQQTQPLKKKSNTAVIAVIAILILALGGAGIFFLTSKDTEDKGPTGGGTDSQVQLGQISPTEESSQPETEPETEAESGTETKPETEAEPETEVESETKTDGTEKDEYSALIPEFVRASKRYIDPTEVQSDYMGDEYLMTEEWEMEWFIHIQEFFGETQKGETAGYITIHAEGQKYEDMEMIVLATNIYMCRSGEETFVFGVYMDGEYGMPALDFFWNDSYVGRMVLAAG